MLWPPILLAWTSLLIRSGLILAAADILRRLSPKSGAYRHGILAVSFALLLLWPALSLVIPEISLPLWPSHAGGFVTVTQIIHSRPDRTLASAAVNWPLLIWGTGVLLSLLPLIVGCLRVRGMGAAAFSITDAEWLNLLAEECKRLELEKAPELLQHARCLIPFTFGIFRPRIVLPAECVQWQSSRRRVVLMHELMHISRHDLAWQILANIVTALWWFQPLCWWTRRALRQESEAACDSGVLDAGIRPSEYATELLKIAQGFSRGRRHTAAAIAMAHPDDLERRLHAILNQRSTGRNRFAIAKVALLACLTISASAVTVSSDNSDFEGGQQMKRTVISGLLASAGLIATSTGAANLPAHPLVNASASTVQPAPAQDPQDRPIRVSGETAQAKLTRKVQPVYPPSAKAARLQGAVKLDVTISKDGVPQDMQVLSSPGDELTQSAMEAVRQWRYSSTLLNGEPVAVIAEVVVNYTLLK